MRPRPLRPLNILLCAVVCLAWPATQSSGPSRTQPSRDSKLEARLHAFFNLAFNRRPPPDQDCRTGGLRLEAVDQRALERAYAERRAEHPGASMTFRGFPNRSSLMIRQELRTQGLCEVSYFGLTPEVNICKGIVYSALDKNVSVPCVPPPDRPLEQAILADSLAFVDAMSQRDLAQVREFIHPSGALTLLLEDNTEGSPPPRTLRVSHQSSPAEWQDFLKNSPGWMPTDTLFRPTPAAEGKTTFTFGGDRTFITLTMSAPEYGSSVEEVRVSRH